MGPKNLGPRNFWVETQKLEVPKFGVQKILGLRIWVTKKSSKNFGVQTNWGLKKIGVQKFQGKTNGFQKKMGLKKNLGF